MQDEQLSRVGSTWSLRCWGCFWLLLPTQTSSLLSGWLISGLEGQCHADEWFVLHLLMTLGTEMFLSGGLTRVAGGSLRCECPHKPFFLNVNIFS